MEKHHKLRRPQGSSIHGCNICGKEGPQAAVCPNGTSTTGPRSSGRSADLDAVAAKQREPDYKAIAERARAFVAERRRRRGGREYRRGPAGGKMPTARRGTGAGAGEGAGEGDGGAASPRIRLARLLRPDGQAVLPQRRHRTDPVDPARDGKLTRCDDETRESRIANRESRATRPAPRPERAFARFSRHPRRRLRAAFAQPSRARDGPNDTHSYSSTRRSGRRRRQRPFVASLLLSKGRPRVGLLDPRAATVSRYP